MRSFSRWLIGPFFLFFFLTSIFAEVALADLHTAKIVDIADGDTVTAVLGQGSLRCRWGGRIAPTRALFVVTPSTFVSMVRRARVDLSDNPVFVEPTK
jgi:hypothetical protein